MHTDYTAHIAASNISRSFADYNDGLPPALRGVGSVAVSSTISEGINSPGSPSLADGNRGLFSLENCSTPVVSEGGAVESVATPFCDTGLPCTKALIDWQSFTFSDCVSLDDVLALLMPNIAPGVDAEEAAARSSWVALDRGMHGYKQSSKRGNITVLHDGAPGMGVHVQMSGEGCRQFEYEQGIQSGEGWVSWFQLAFSRGARWTRLDVAMDDHEGLLNLDTVQAAINVGHLTSVWRKTSTVQEKRLGRLREGETEAAQTSNTIYLGSRKNSNMFVRIYNKSLERLDKLGFEPSVGVDIPHWVRCELCARSENAELLVKMIRLAGFTCVPEVLRSYLDFKQPSETDSNISRWETAPWWASFLGNVEKRSLGVKPAVNSLAKSAAWLLAQAGPTIAMMVEAAGGGLEYLSRIALEGKKRFRPAHRAMVAAHISTFGAGGGSSGFWQAPGNSLGGVLNV